MEALPLQLTDFESAPNLVRLFLDRADERGDRPFLAAKRAGKWQSQSWRETAEQVEHERRNTETDRRTDPALLISASAAYRRARARFHVRNLIGSRDCYLSTSCCDVCSGNAQVAVIGERLND